ncbi:MAG: rhomboid family intramembrane serine protease [Xanthomonadales bacterium]|nr:rhomboid family intramembrane serine protease [Xanthomonadales bacterium]NIN60444.1 rhomboid family intramembrane serine protease [Xanthomonadales bacterium]NIN75797.1 rhomboid family intramembrane serine protease [Xanthomonadales bacterium]NIO12975.1 rhomboid family intramembrane serine protease [Xanthomonadales bacterium]NIP12837.1 rhomboid family intramembrane serine protease [Xanthomonadales bacterium]
MQPPASIAIIIACAAVFLLNNLSPALALWPLQSGHFGPWQLLSYAFLHGGLNHIFFNMFALWMFGLPLERAWGSQRFLLYYLVCILGAAITQLVVQQLSGDFYPTIGASGAVFGLLLAYGVMWPENRILLLFFPVPVKAKWFVLIYGAIELVFGVTQAMPQIAHFAHLGGLFFGAGLLWRWGWRPGMTWRR